MNVDDIYNKTVTIVNKLKKADNDTGSDIWKKTVINGVDYKRVANTTVNGATVSIGETLKVLIPFNKGYLPYLEWKNDIEKGFTVSQGDYIFLDMELTETVSSSTITAIKNQYEPNVCDVRVVQVAKNNGLTKVQVMIEGV